MHRSSTRRAPRGLFGEQPDGHPFLVRKFISYDSKLQLESLNHVHANAINTEPTFPRLPANRTYRRDDGIDEIDPKLPSTMTLADGRIGWKAVIQSSRLNVASAPKNGHSRSGQVHSADRISARRQSCASALYRGQRLITPARK